MDRVELEAGLWALTVGGWTVDKVSMYDQEGVEGWQWHHPDDRYVHVIGGWDDLPSVPVDVVDAYCAWGRVN
jgi:hypothetical protein